MSDRKNVRERRIAATLRFAGVVLCLVCSPAALPQTAVEVQTEISRSVARAFIQDATLPQLSTAEMISFLSGIFIVAPEEYQALLATPEALAQVRKPGFAACARGLESFAKALASAHLLKDIRDIEEVFARHGVDPALARRNWQENEALISLASELAQEARLAEAYAAGRNTAEGALAIRQHRQKLTDIGRIGMAATMSDGLPMIVVAASQQAWLSMGQRRFQMASIISPVICPK